MYASLHYIAYYIITPRARTASGGIAAQLPTTRFPRRLSLLLQQVWLTGDGRRERRFRIVRALQARI